MNFTVNWISPRVFVSIEILVYFYFALEESLHFRFKIQNGFEDNKLRNFVYSYTIIAKRLTKY